MLAHTTSQEKIAKIMQEGLKGVSYWCEVGSLSAYYAETVRDEGDDPAVLLLPVEILEAYQPEPDKPGLEEPLSFTLGMKDEEIWEAWQETNGSWQACLELIGSLRCRAPIPANVILEYNPHLASPSVRASRSGP